MVYFLFGIHNHQPVDNFEEVLERAYRVSYLPFLEVLEKHPGVRLSLHSSGCLLEWFEAKHPEYLDRVKALSDRGQVEVLGGGFYEPIISSLPEKDQRGQIKMMREFLAKRFGAAPRGFWLAERVWEPQLPKVLAKNGVDYTIVDDTHFMQVGYAEKELTGYFLTEADGSEIKAFPISQRLRYLIPFQKPEETIEYLRTFDGKERALVMADDGEKFGLWPKTHELVYGAGWLDRFFSLLEQNSAWLKTATFSEYLDAHEPLGRAYLPTTSYSELTEWALTPDSAQELHEQRAALAGPSARFVRGGYFRNFLTKYPEANRMYRKMLRVSKKVNAAAAPRAKAQARAAEQALEYLWKGECNCAYWHGVFGGLYLPHLRHAVYSNLLRAEALADAGKKGGFSFDQEDWDADGAPELLVESPKANWYFAPGKGGGLWEWDLKAPAVNLAGLVSRRKEAYHADLSRAVVGGGEAGKSIHDLVLAKEPGLEKLLHYDWHNRMSLVDHFLHPDTRAENFAAVKYGEQGDFVLGKYRVAEVPHAVKGQYRLALEREGTVWDHSVGVPVRVRKTITLQESGAFTAEYSVANLGQNAAKLWFGVELVAAFVDGASFGPGVREEKGVAVKRFVDEPRGVSIRLSAAPAMDLWTFPIYTISQSEEGFEKTYQGSVLLCHRALELSPGQAAEFSLGCETA